MSAMSRYRYATNSKRALFRKRCPLRACALYIPSLNNWQLTDVDGSAVKWIRRTVVEPLLKIYTDIPVVKSTGLSYSSEWASETLRSVDNLPVNDPIDPGALTHRDRTQSAQCWHHIRPIHTQLMFKTANRPNLVRNLPVTLSRYPF